MAPSAQVITACLLALLGCNRYEMKREQCPEPRPVLAIRATGATPGTLSGIVRFDSLDVSAVGAEVQLRKTTDLAQPALASRLTDSTGTFAFDSLVPGRYAVFTRRIGAAARLDTVTITERAGVHMILAIQPMVIDGCGFGVAYVKRAWWKLW